MPAITTRSGCHIRHPPLPDQHKTRRKASNADNALEPPKRSCPRRRAGPKSVIDHGDDHPELSIRPPPKPRPLAQSKRSGPMTSSAEEEIFEASFSRRSSMIPATSDIAIDQQSHPSHVQLADDTSLTHAKFCLLADEEVSADIQEGDVESGKHFIMTNDLNGRNVNDQGTSGETYSLFRYSNKDHGKDTSGTSTKSRYPEEGGNDDGHKTSATSTNGRPRRSGGVKSYAPDRSAGEESSPSDSDWAVDEEQRKKAQQTTDHDIAVNHGEDDEAPSEADPPSPPSEDEDDKDFVKTKGRMPQVGILKAQELGKKTLEAARTLGQEYGKSARTILIEAGLTMKATHKESPWNQHQTWFTATHPLPKGVSGVVSPEDVKAWKVKQQVHYKAHPQDDPQHASLWKEIQENWDHAVAGTTEDLTSHSAAGLMMMGVRDAFTKSAAYWHRTHGIHIAGVAIFPGDEEAGRQASGLFAGSDMVKALINSHQLDIKHWLDELTTILKYKDLEAAHTEGKTFSLLPASSTAPNGSLLCNSKPARDRNRKVAPMMITEAGHLLKTSNSRWLTILDILYTEKLCIHDWPTAPYLRLHLGAMYEAELGLDDNDNNSEAEAAKAKKRKGKSKKSGDKGRKKGAVVEEPSVILHISRWPESDILTVETQATSMCLIPLVIDTNSKVVLSLQDSEKFIKDLPQDNTQDDTQDDTPRRRTKQVIKKPTVSNLTASRSTMGASRSNQEASRSHRHTNRAIYDNFPPLSPPAPSSQFLSPPPISRTSTPMSTLGYPHVGDATYPSRSRYEHSHDGPRRYQRAFDDAMPTYNPDTRKWTRPHYESARETEDLECETVEERHRVRVHENSHIPLGRTQSQARVSSAPIASTSRSRLLSHSSVVPTSRTGSSQRRNHSTVRPSHIRPASPDRRAIIEEDEDEYY
ncbi:uncharacterized protein F5147DRAFT_782873 [Suillus discolor]|uniref:Uncharacterized protein n=1 Tax=Suillus discolor TaxID=1912936 RepID=A0A9P7EQE6_9AGAM|nr:uncharacterized protein F5147DRAFT_782873 [Suillus discolor]KAG2083551.1 hypothetical protein F5147DRAFT_782873 [Suillus discolor]